MLDIHKSCPSHCCKEHGCKYGYDDCPVVLGTAPQEYRQECCDMHDYIMREHYEAVVADLTHIGKINLAAELTIRMKQFKKRGPWDY